MEAYGRKENTFLSVLITLPRSSQKRETYNYLTQKNNDQAPEKDSLLSMADTFENNLPHKEAWGWIPR